MHILIDDSEERVRTTATNTALDLFNQALGNKEKLTLAMMGSVLSCFGSSQGRPIIVHLKDDVQKTILIFTFVHGNIIQVKNTSDQTLLTARGIGFNVCKRLGGTGHK